VLLASKELEGDARGYRSAEVAARELTRSIRREVTKLSETWVALLARSDNRQILLEDTIQVRDPRKNKASHLLKCPKMEPSFLLEKGKLKSGDLI